MTGIYYTLANVDPNLNSLLKNIFLFALCRTVDIRKHGLQIVLKLFVKEMVKLSTFGIDLNLKFQDGSSQAVNIKGSLGLVISDNLAAHEVAGLRTCFSSGPICRLV